jgi:hypothetical protein
MQTIASIGYDSRSLHWVDEDAIVIQAEERRDWLDVVRATSRRSTEEQSIMAGNLT